MERTEFHDFRKKLEKTQLEMSRLLGTSIKAIHSYEQGWRRIPTHVERQLFFLLSLKSGDKRAGKDGKVPPNWFDDGRISGSFKERTSHPTQKPIVICDRFVSAHSDKSVLDLFGGSGSTMIACENVGRENYSMELDEKYCDVIINRWQNYTGKQATLEATGQTYKELYDERA